MESTAEDWVSASESSEQPEPATSAATCATCQKPQSDLPTPLKHCAKCKTTQYCSVDCQKSDWKIHKRTCGKSDHNNKHNPGFHGANALLGLTDDKYLHNLPEKDVFTQLVDCYRLRVEDEYNFQGAAGGLYVGEDPMPDFKRFLDLAEKRKGLLPDWWGIGKRRECEREAVRGEWANIGQAVEKSDIVSHYGNPMMPMTLRVLGEKIYEKGFM
ncbi:hypothetical protein VTL71DRAFT_1265 [Oculimacula yallundae]|uniref:MYND-type domain-containing protein n=1 Tax=Oculimacula yallundae TaxID=86028 RepID=A0ABR4CC42_9HELO